MGTGNALNLGQQGVTYFDGTSVFTGVDGNTAGFTLTSNGPGVAPSFQSTGGLPYISLSPYIVGTDTHSGYATIQSAINAAAGAGASINNIFVVYVKPKANGAPYVENITLANYVYLVSVGNSVQITGKVSCGAVTSKMQGFTLTNPIDYFFEMTGVGNVDLINCFLTINGNDGIHMTAAGDLKLIECQGNHTTNHRLFVITNTNTSNPVSGFRIWATNIANIFGATTASTISGGQVTVNASAIFAPITTSGTSSINVFGSQINCSGINTTALTIGGSGTNLSTGSSYQSGTASAISIGSTLTAVDLKIGSSNTNAITGAGALNFSGLNFTNTSSLVNTTTQTANVQYLGAQRLVSPAGDYTVLASDSIVAADSSAARAITLNASPSTGQTVTIKDDDGTAGTNNITITPAAGNIDGAGTYVMNVNYQSVTLTYSGTKWLVI